MGNCVVFHMVDRHCGPLFHLTRKWVHRDAMAVCMRSIGTAPLTYYAVIILTVIIVCMFVFGETGQNQLIKFSIWVTEAHHNAFSFILDSTKADWQIRINGEIYSRLLHVAMNFKCLLLSLSTLLEVIWELFWSYILWCKLVYMIIIERMGVMCSWPLRFGGYVLNTLFFFFHTCELAEFPSEVLWTETAIGQTGSPIVAGLKAVAPWHWES